MPTVNAHFVRTKISFRPCGSAFFFVERSDRVSELNSRAEPPSQHGECSKVDFGATPTMKRRGRRVNRPRGRRECCNHSGDFRYHGG